MLHTDGGHVVSSADLLPLLCDYKQCTKHICSDDLKAYQAWKYEIQGENTAYGYSSVFSGEFKKTHSLSGEFMTSDQQQ